jgi:hypothetical protein
VFALYGKNNLFITPSSSKTIKITNYSSLSTAAVFATFYLPTEPHSRKVLPKVHFILSDFSFPVNFYFSTDTKNLAVETKVLLSVL